MVTYTNWFHDQPNNYNNEDCAAIDAKRSKWFDRDCNSVYTFICEVEAEKSKSHEDKGHFPSVSTYILLGN